jgi:hypothetical protein
LDEPVFFVQCRQQLTPLSLQVPFPTFKGLQDLSIVIPEKDRMGDWGGLRWIGLKPIAAGTRKVARSCRSKILLVQLVNLSFNWPGAQFGRN